jgi:hypothetical protein
MAVQPDKRSREVQLREAGLNSTERFRVGEYTLRALALSANPRHFTIARDRPGLERGLSVYYDLHDGWTVWDEGERFVTREGPLPCLEWFVARQP